MLVERRFVIDFVAGRRMVVTDDIEAKLAITEVLSRCCRALDQMDRDLMDTVWHPDGTAGYGPTFRGSVSGLPDVMWANHARLPGHSHQVTSRRGGLPGRRGRDGLTGRFLSADWGLPDLARRAADIERRVVLQRRLNSGQH